MQDGEYFWVALEMEMSERVIHQSNRMMFVYWCPTPVSEPVLTVDR
jgi:hypothetical protein